MSKALEVIVSDGGSMSGILDKAASRLSGMQYQAAVMRAMNRSALSGRQEAVSAIRDGYRVKANVVRRHFTITKAHLDELEALVSAKGNALPISAYAFRPKADTTGDKRKLVRVAIKKDGPLRPLPNAFVHNGQVYRRKGKASYPIELVYGPAIPMLADNDPVRDRVHERMIEAFSKRLDHEVERILDVGVVGLGGKKKIG